MNKKFIWIAAAALALALAFTGCKDNTSGNTSKITIQFNLNGGSGKKPGNIVTTSGTEVEFPTGEGLKRGSQAFDAWCDKSTGEDGDWVDGGDYYNAARNITFYARYRAVQTPVADDYNIVITSPQTEGDIAADAVRITPKAGKSQGARTILYNGSASGLDSLAAGTYTVTFNVAASSGWSAATGLQAGTLAVNPHSGGNPTPVTADFDIVVTSPQIEGSVAFDSVRITPKPGKSQGLITILYNGSAGDPGSLAAGTYTVTFNVAADTANNFAAAAGLPAGTLTVNDANGNPPAPAAVTAADFDITINTPQTVGSVSAAPVSVTPKAGKSQGLITILYNGTAVVPSAAGEYTVTFNVGVDTANNFAEAAGLAAGALVIQAAGPPASGLQITVGSAITGVPLADIHAEGGSVTLIDNDAGFEYTTGSADYEGNYAAIKVDLGAGKKLSDFERLTFRFNGVGGDVDYKNLQLWVSASAITGNKYDGASTALQMQDIAPQYVGPAGPEEMAIVINPEKAEKVAGSTVYFAIYVPSGSGKGAVTYRISNLKFVPHPDFVPVTGITGVPLSGVINTAVDLTAAKVAPYNAAAKNISWSVDSSTAAGVSAGALADGKFTPTGAGTVKVTATVANAVNGGTAAYTESFDIIINASAASDISVTFGTGNTTVTNSSQGNLSYPAGGFSYAVDGNFNTWAYFTVNLGSFNLAAFDKITFTVSVSGGDPNYKKVGLMASASAPSAYPGEPDYAWNYGNSATNLEFPITQEMAAISSSTPVITIWVHCPQGQTVTVTNVKLAAKK